MKNLILILSLFISFSLFAKNVNYTADGKTMFLKQKDCMAKNAVCYAFPVGQSYSDFELVDQYRNGDAISSKSPILPLGEISKCGEYCQVFYDTEGYTCEDPEETLILNLDLEEIYCSKFLRFEQVKTGNKVLKLSEVKKSARLKINADKKELKDKDDIRKAIAFEALKQTCATTQDPIYKNLCILLMK